jgi:hypothetical protein
MVTYASTRDGNGIMADGAWVPESDENRDWRAYQAFLAGGGLPQAAENLPVADERTAAKTRVDAEADRQRRLAADPELSTPGFAAKLAEAKAVLAEVAASQTPLSANYPILAAEIAVTAETDLAVVAQAVVDADTAARAEWAKVEAARLQAHQAIDSAGTVASIEAVQPAINWTAAVPIDQPLP